MYHTKNQQVTALAPLAKDFKKPVQEVMIYGILTADIPTPVYVRLYGSQGNGENILVDLDRMAISFSEEWEIARVEVELASIINANVCLVWRE
jgi:hypothetical protein